MNPWKSLFRSRKFWMLILDTVVSAVFLVGGWYLKPEEMDKVLGFVGLLQPVFITLIGAIAYEDGKAMMVGIKR